MSLIEFAFTRRHLYAIVEQLGQRTDSEPGHRRRRTGLVNRMSVGTNSVALDRPVPLLARIWAFGKYVLGIGLLLWVIWANWEPGESGVGLKTVLNRPIHVLALLAAIGTCAIAIQLTFVRWYVLVRAQGLPFTLRDAFRLGMVGFACSAFLPGSVGGDIIKAAFLAREQQRRTVAVATVVFDRVLGLVGLFWLASLIGGIAYMFAEVKHPVLGTILLSVSGVCLGSMIAWFVIGFLPEFRSVQFAAYLQRVPKIGGALAELWRAGWMFRCRGRAVLIALLLSVAGHVAFVLLFYWSALTLFSPGQIPALSAHFIIIPIGKVVEAGFPAPGGMGGGEFAFGKLYEALGTTAAVGVTASLVQRATYWLWGFVGYLGYLRLRPTLMSSKASDVEKKPSVDLPVAKSA